MFEINENYIIKIKNFYFSKKGQGISRFLRQNKEIDKYLQDVILKTSWFKNKILAFCLIAKGYYTQQHCPVCNKILNPIKVKKGRKYCSVICASNDNEIINKKKKTLIQRYGNDKKEIVKKRKQTCLRKYGNQNPICNEEISKKRKQTCLRKYGTETVLSNNDIRQKIYKTNIKKYGVKLPLQNEKILNKSIENNFKKYGVKSTSQLQHVKEKMFKTNIQKYGNKCSLQNEKIKQKSLKTIKQRYNVQNCMQSEEIVKKASTSQRKKSFNRILTKWKNYVIPLFNENEYEGYTNKIYKWKCVKCGNEFEQKIYTTGIGESRYIPRCLNCLPLYKSLDEKQVAEFISNIYSNKLIFNDKTLIKPYELDIVIPDKKIAIEFDGIYWHSNKDKNYHLNKTKLCQKKGYRLIHIWQNEWNEKKQIVKKYIKSVLGVYEKNIDVNKCKLKQIENIENFIKENYIGHNLNYNKFYGLFYEKELISVLMVNKDHLMKIISNMSYDIDNVITRLKDVFPSRFDGNLRIQFDRRYENGEKYKELELIEETQPQLIEINNYKIYDCGKLIYKIKERNE